MDKELEKQLNRILKRQRPRPFVRCANRNGKKCYVRTKSKSYFQMLEERPKPWWHNFAKALKGGPMGFHFFGLLE